MRKLWEKIVVITTVTAMLCSAIPVMADEVDVFTGNLSLDRQVTVSGLEPGVEYCTGELAVDGDLDTRWSSGIMKNGNSADQVQTPQWLTVDLEKEWSDITSIRISYFKLVWGQKYAIQTADTDDVDTTWKTIETKELAPDGSRQNPTDVFQFEEKVRVKRYLRIYFEKVNTSAGGNCVSITELEVNGTQPQSGEFEPGTAVQALSRIQDIVLTQEDSVLPLPEYENYAIEVKGSEVKNVLALDGSVTAHNIGDRSFQVILEASGKSNPEDKAEKSITVTVPDKSGMYPERFPQVKSPNQEPEIIPSLQEWYGYEGTFQMTEDTRILFYDHGGVGLQKVAESMQSDIEEFTGIRLEILSVSDDSLVTGKDIYIESLQEDLYQTGAEGYYLIIDESGIRIYSAAYTGCLYGTITIEQILWQDQERLQVPYGVIRDYPNFEIRGVMLDIARTPYRMQLLKDYGKILSWYKMNEYHLHINDNIHFSQHYPTYESIGPGLAMHRIQSEEFPSLQSLSKGDTDAVHYFENVYGDPHYTKEEWKQLQADVKEYGVNIMTEIDSPSHAALYSKYAIDNPDGISWLGPIHNERNYEQIALVGENSERAMRFMTTLWEEYTNPEDPTFTHDVVGIGLDEYWNPTQDEKRAMADYITNLYNVLKKNGKTPRMWGQIGLYLDNISSDEVIEGMNDMQLDVWYTAYENVNKRIQQGFKLVNMDEGWLYGNPLRDRRDVVNVEYLYENWTPEVFNGITLRKGEPALLGAKTALWGDVNRKGIIEKDLSTRILPAVAVVSEKTWGGVRENDSYEAYEYKFNRLKEGPGTEIAMNIKTKSSLIAEYDFANKKDGILYDASGNGYHAEIEGGKVAEEGKTVYLKFDGNTKVDTPLKTLSYPYTVTFDLKLDSGDTNDKEASLFSGYDGRLQAAGENGSMSLNRSFFQQSFDYTLPKNKKVHVTIVGTFQGTKLYIDGKLFKFLYRNNTDEFDLTDLASSFVFPLEEIGRGFQGYLANIKAYNKALSPEVIAGQQDGYVNVAQNAAAAGDSQRKGEGGFDNANKKIRVAWKAVDGDGRDLLGEFTGRSSEVDSYWRGGGRNDDSLSIDLGEMRNIEKVRIQWEGSGYGASFSVQVSDDGLEWSDVKTITGNGNDLTTVTFPAVKKQYVRMQGISMNGNNPYAIREFEVYEKIDKAELEKQIEKAQQIVEEKQLGHGKVGENEQLLWDAYVYAKALRSSPIAKQSEVDEAVEAVIEGIQVSEESVYQANFQGGTGATGTQPENLEAKEGELIKLPQNTFKREGYEFAGWSYQDRTYQPQESFPMPGENVVFLAVWKKAVPPETEVNPPVWQPGKVSGLAVSATKTSSIKLTWKKVTNAKGYVVERYDSKKRKWVKVKDTNGVTCTDQKLNFGTVYKYRVRAYGQSGNTVLAGSNSNVLTTATAPKKPVLSMKKLSNTKVKLSWKKGTRADKFEVYVKAGKGKFRMITEKPGKKRTYISANLKKGTKYYFKVRGYKKAGKEKCTSVYSVTRKIKVKK